MIDLMSKKKYFFAISILVILAGIIGLIVNGLQLDIQFKGGTRLEIEMNDANIDTNKATQLVRDTVNKIASTQVSQTYNAEDTANSINLLVVNVADTLTPDELNLVDEAIRKEFNVKEDAEMQVLSVQPFIGKELRDKGIQAAFLASVLIVIYVAWRFSVMSGLSAGLMAVVALIHDIAVMFSMYTIFMIPINDSFIAAVLTILGYSMNDTIIIYDRIRENSTLMRKVPLDELVNRSIMQTLARSINTVFTTLVCIITLFIFASINNISSIKEFTLPLIVGLTSGAYSSIFIASPLWMMWKESKQKKKIKTA